MLPQGQIRRSGVEITIVVTNACRFANAFGISITSGVANAYGIVIEFDVAKPVYIDDASANILASAEWSVFREMVRSAEMLCLSEMVGLC